MPEGRGGSGALPLSRMRTTLHCPGASSASVAILAPAGRDERVGVREPWGAMRCRSTDRNGRCWSGAEAAPGGVCACCARRSVLSGRSVCGAVLALKSEPSQLPKCGRQMLSSSVEVCLVGVAHTGLGCTA